ncbi:MAG: hypothetical protein U0892_19895 [Pirellulales bacterium]
MHVVMQPSYASKYPLGSSVLIAIGLISFGSPWAGSWIGASMMTASSMWMTRALLPKRWVLLGGWLLVLHPFVQVAWSQSLMHGFLPATAAALLTGAILRLRRRFHWPSAIAAGTGIVIFMHSRPYEGLVCCLLFATVAALICAKQSLREAIDRVFRCAVIVSPIVLLGLAILIVHNVSVTGQWYKLPYQLHEDQYGVAGLFVFSPARTEHAIDQAMVPATVREFQASDSAALASEGLGVVGWSNRLSTVVELFLALCCPFVFAAFLYIRSCFRFRVVQALAVAILVQATASSCVNWVFAHYLAPMLPWTLLLTLISVRIAYRSGRLARGRRLEMAFALLFMLDALGIAGGSWINRRITSLEWGKKREGIEAGLLEQGGKHLVFVHYSPEHFGNDEWVYNGPDPKNAPIVWARAEREDWVKEVLSAYGTGRTIWTLEADERQPTLSLLKP